MLSVILCFLLLTYHTIRTEVNTRFSGRCQIRRINASRRTQKNPNDVSAVIVNENARRKCVLDMYQQKDSDQTVQIAQSDQSLLCWHRRSIFPES